MIDHLRSHDGSFRTVNKFAWSLPITAARLTFRTETCAPETLLVTFASYTRHPLLRDRWQGCMTYGVVTAVLYSLVPQVRDNCRIF